MAYRGLKILKGIKKVLIDVFNLSYKAIYGHAKWALAAVIVTICAQILCRNILRTNIRWNQEVALLLTVQMAFLGVAAGAEKNPHIGAELLYDKFSVKIRNVTDVLNRIITLLVGAFFTVYGVRMVLSTIDSRLLVAEWPSSLMYITIPVNGIAIIYFVVFNITDLKEYKKTDDAGKSSREEEEKE